MRGPIAGRWTTRTPQLFKDYDILQGGFGDLEYRLTVLETRSHRKERQDGFGKKATKDMTDEEFEALWYRMTVEEFREALPSFLQQEEDENHLRWKAEVVMMRRRELQEDEKKRRVKEVAEKKKRKTEEEEEEHLWRAQRALELKRKIEEKVWT